MNWEKELELEGTRVTIPATGNATHEGSFDVLPGETPAQAAVRTIAELRFQLEVASVDSEAVCHFCAKALPSGDDWCYGCKHYICEDCDNVSDDLAGKHSVDAHESPVQCVVRCSLVWEEWASSHPIGSIPGSESMDLAAAVRVVRALE